MTTMISSFGDYIRKRRLDLDITQQEVAKKAGVTQNFIAYLESNKRKAPTWLIKRLGEILSLPLDTLYMSARPEAEAFIDFDREKNTAKRKLAPALLALKLDTKLCSQHKVNDADIAMLASLKARGEIRSKEDYIFLLLSLRQVMR